MTQFLWAPGHHKGLADVSQVGEAPSVSHHATSLSPQLKSCCTQFPFLFAPGTILIVFHLDIISCLANVDFILTFTRGCVYFGQPDLSAADSLMLLWPRCWSYQKGNLQPSNCTVLLSKWIKGVNLGYSWRLISFVQQQPPFYLYSVEVVWIFCPCFQGL